MLQTAAAAQTSTREKGTQTLDSSEMVCSYTVFACLPSFCLHRNPALRFLFATVSQVPCPSCSHLTSSSFTHVSLLLRQLLNRRCS
jgi:hypothetical protein